MADDIQLSQKRKYEEEGAAGSAVHRVSGFAAPPPSDPSGVASAPSYGTVPPPLEGIELAKQRAQEIAKRLSIDADAKRLRVENGAAADDAADKGFSSSGADLSHLRKPLSQQATHLQVNTGAPASFATYGYSSTSRKIEIPNCKVGVIIGKGGETIRYLQLQSGAKIQVTRDAEAYPGAQTRLVELMGTAEQIDRAEQLINDVLRETDAGGSGTVAARKFVGGVQAGSEQFTMKVPNNRVGLIIGKGGETIKSMQAKSGARIQIIPLHLPPGDTSTERNIQIDGSNEEIESAKQLINEVMSENRVRNPSGGGYHQQNYQPPQAPTGWAPPGPPPMQQPGYGYMQPGTYPAPQTQYSMHQPPYAGYPPSASGYSGSWDQNSNTPSQQASHGTGYDYYNQQQPPPVAGSAISGNSGYNYGQPQPSAYGTPSSYNQSYSQPPILSQGYSQDGYSSGYPATGHQAGAGYTPTESHTQPSYDQQLTYGSAPAYAGAPQDGSTVNYDTTQPPAAQPPINQQSFSSQQSSNTDTSYPSQVTGYGGGTGTPQTPQPSYGNQPPSTGYGQTTPSQASYPQLPPQGPTNSPAQAGIAQPVPVQSSYSQPLSAQSGYAQQDSGHQAAPSVGPGGPPVYAQQQSYGGVQPQGQPGYAQQMPQPPYPNPYGHGSGGGSYTQPPAPHSTGSDALGGAHGSYGATSQSGTSGTTEAPPPS